MTSAMPTSRRTALLFAASTVIGLIFAAVSYVAALGENATDFGFVAAVKLNLVQFYLWGIFSPLLFYFSRRFPIELRPLNVRNLLLHIPALDLFAIGHQAAHLTILWFISPRTRQRFAEITDYYRAY